VYVAYLLHHARKEPQRPLMTMHHCTVENFHFS
jgi:hypothetical protein